MQRREFVAGAVSVACAGVVGASRVDAFEGFRVARPGRLDGAGGGGGTVANRGDGSDGADGERPPASTLEVLSTVSGSTPVHLRLVRADGTVAHGNVREMRYGERAHLSGLMDRGETYQFTLAVEGATLVHEAVDPGERAVFELVDETTVSVVA
jgi:hypothetical protein